MDYEIVIDDKLYKETDFDKFRKIATPSGTIYVDKDNNIQYIVRNQKLLYDRIKDSKLIDNLTAGISGYAGPRPFANDPTPTLMLKKPYPSSTIMGLKRLVESKVDSDDFIELDPISFIKIATKVNRKLKALAVNAQLEEDTTKVYTKIINQVLELLKNKKVLQESATLSIKQAEHALENAIQHGDIDTLKNLIQEIVGVKSLDEYFSYLRNPIKLKKDAMRKLNSNDITKFESYHKYYKDLLSEKLRKHYDGITGWQYDLIVNDIEIVSIFLAYETVKKQQISVRVLQARVLNKIDKLDADGLTKLGKLLAKVKGFKKVLAATIVMLGKSLKR